MLGLGPGPPYKDYLSNTAWICCGRSSCATTAEASEATRLSGVHGDTLREYDNVRKICHTITLATTYTVLHWVVMGHGCISAHMHEDEDNQYYISKHANGPSNLHSLCYRRAWCNLTDFINPFGFAFRIFHGGRALWKHCLWPHL
jgi:hypothetical protein